jgi:hypothetical protein
MAADMLTPVTPPGGFPRLPDERFHPISVRMESDVTECSCRDCGFSESTGAGMWKAVADGANHAIATGHTVTERHVRVTVISERRPPRRERP